MVFSSSAVDFNTSNLRDEMTTLQPEEKTAKGQVNMLSLVDKIPQIIFTEYFMCSHKKDELGLLLQDGVTGTGLLSNQ